MIGLKNRKSLIPFQKSDWVEILFAALFFLYGRKKYLKIIPLEKEKYGEEFVYSFFYDTVLEFMF